MRLAPILPALLLPLLALFGFVSLAAAQGEDQNCVADLPASFPDDGDWREAYILKDQATGDAWQRAVVTRPTEMLYLQEMKPVKITGTAAQNSPVQLYLYEKTKNPNGDGVQKPTQALCIKTTADSSGLFTFQINARVLWGAMGKELVVDPYYRMEQSWNQLDTADTGQNFTIGTNIPLRSMTVAIEGISDNIVIVDGDDDDDNPRLPANDDDDDTVDPGNDDDDDDNDDDNNPPDKPLNYDLPSYGCYEQPTNEMDPAEIDGDKVSHIFSLIDENPVMMNILANNSNLDPSDFAGAPSMKHTHYAGTPTKKAYSAEKLVEISMRAIVMEHIKRYLLGNSNAGSSKAGALKEFTAVELKQFAGGSGKHAIMVTDVREALTDGPDRSTSLRRVKKTILDARDKSCEADCAGFDYEPNVERIDFWETLLPPVSTEDSWAEDFEEMVLFWTGGKQIMRQMVADDATIGWNYLENESGYNDSQYMCGSWNLVFVQGLSPRLILHRPDPVVLTPDFNDIILHTSNMDFDDRQSWHLPAGDKPELYYKYRPVTSFNPKAVADVCLNEDSLPLLTADLKAAYGLTAAETALVEKELRGNIPGPDQPPAAFTIADPDDIAQRISWQGNGQQLLISQLFFDHQSDIGCTDYHFTPSTEPTPFPAARDGFEVGMVR